MRISLTVISAVIVAASIAVIGAQHREHSTANHSTGIHQLSHQACASHDAAGAGATGHHAEMSAALGLTAEQLSAIERISAEACAALAKYHEQILAVLTPEQRARMQEHHGARDHGGDPAHATTRRHGGR